MGKIKPLWVQRVEGSPSKPTQLYLGGVIIRKMSTLNPRQRCSRMYVLTDKNSPHARHNCFVLTKFREWKGNHESWIIVTKHARIMNLCTLGIMTKRDSEKSPTKYRHKLVAFDPGNAGYGVSESLSFKKFFPGKYAPGLPYIIRAFGADNPLASPWPVTCYKI